ncbi:MAG: hypothetical protein CL759_01295 [Chloroflexi bacterium]|nr:hypothetical protein [Chloroflexota bacterium]
MPRLPNAAHQASHVSGGADALKLDDLADPDDNTDLDFSTSLHGLVPKGTNVGDYLKDDGTWSTVSPGTVTREGGNTTEATTTSTAQVDLLSASSLSVTNTHPLDYHVAARKTSGAAAVSCGLKLNTTASNSGNRGTWRTGTTNINEFGSHRGWIPGRVGGSYTRMGQGSSVAYGGGTTQDSSGSNSIGEGNDMITATITDLVVTGICGSSSNTLGADELQVYSGSAS